MAQLIRATNGECLEVFPADREQGFTCAELHALIGGGCRYIETIRLLDGRIMILDEEGKLHKKTAILNERATMLLWSAGGAPDDFIVGNVVICKYPEEIN